MEGNSEEGMEEGDGKGSRVRGKIWRMVDKQTEENMRVKKGGEKHGKGDKLKLKMEKRRGMNEEENGEIVMEKSRKEDLKVN